MWKPSTGTPRARMRVLRLVGALAILSVVVAIHALVIYSGLYDVSVQSGHSRLVAGVLSGLMVRSVRAHARDIRVPAGVDFRNPEMLDKGAAHYEQMCRMCHGAPGVKAAPWDLYPPAPDLVEALREKRWTDPEIFWMLKYGIKDTAMPAFGSTHDDDDLWAMTALVRELSTIGAKQYQKMSKRGLERGGEMGEHGYHGGVGATPEAKPGPPAVGEGREQHKHDRHKHQ
jgi:hypothetical protein